MGIRDIIRNIGDRRAGIRRTPYGILRLAKDGRRVRKATVDVALATDALTRKDIADWRRAWQMAINADNPDRQRLYDIYRDVEADLHLSGCVGQRVGFAMARSFKIVDPATGEEDGDALRCFDQAWFKQLMRHCLDSVFWGHSLVELGDVVAGENGLPRYSGVALIPRKHVVPEFGRVVVNAGDDWRTGIDYRSEPYASWLIEAGRPGDLGLYLRAAMQAIPKKNMLAYWDAFGEGFGMPVRVARTAARDDKERNRILAMLQAAAGRQSIVVDQDTEIEFVESSRGDAYNVYDRRVDRANSEMSKLVVGQTMTVEDGSSLSQSQTHLQVFQNLVEANCDMLRDIVNDQLIPRMARHGFPVKGLRFDWDYAVDYTPEQQVAYETMVADRYEVDPGYFAEKYSMPVGERRSQPAMPALGGGGYGTPDASDGKQRKNSKPGFFG